MSLTQATNPDDAGGKMLDAPAPGTRIAGKYEVDQVLGKGGMGVVVAARHLITGNRVAIKFLLSSASQSPNIVARFVNEARAAVQIQSEHVARVIDVDTLPNGLPYMVMELLDGLDLSQEISRRMSITPEVAVSYVLQALEALAEAHALGIVHRDLKPANLFLARRRDGSSLVKVLDFGISKLNPSAMDPGGLTKTGSVLGSPLYMSPEQLTSAKGVDARSDIWSIGVVLFELLSGNLPFFDETLGGLVVKIATQPPIDIRAVVNVPPGLVQVLQKCLEKDCANRFQTVADLALALEPYGPASARLSVERISRIIEERPHPSQPMPLAHETIDIVARPAGTGAGTQNAWAPETATVHLPVQSRKPLWVGVTLAAVVLLAGTGVLLSGAFGRSTAPGSSAAAAPSPAPDVTSVVPAASTSSSPVVTPADLPAPATSAERRADAARGGAAPKGAKAAPEPAPKAAPEPAPKAAPEPPPKAVEPPPKAVEPPPKPAAPPKKPIGPEEFGGK